MRKILALVVVLKRHVQERKARHVQRLLRRETALKAAEARKREVEDRFRRDQTKRIDIG